MHFCTVYFSFAQAGHRGTCLRPLGLHIFGLLCFALLCVSTRRLLNTCLPTAQCQPVSGISGRRHLRSTDRGHLHFPRVKLASYGGRSFAYAGPSNWNSLPLTLETVVFLFHLLSTTSTPFSSLSTRLAHAASLGLLLLFIINQALI